ncbi:Gfo/Idh/MocA family protein [Pedobacter chitinilyticus]|uniref:Gfo/Idh/MocA family oxidoreductase n=1 Tax=Pedobacter chitinilyticus TaxID=2233776 RepID=A0A3S3R942_9SPHI|nr:Gfo/Idh/MocA family oxidoreductase [Pedobacter chitinilyticus]RWU10771.1 gfo/Idh/MocA family oxidoreductase [Pedobacter chitinilyticus]
MNRKDFVTMGSLAAMSLLVNNQLMAAAFKGKRIGIVGLDSSHAIAFTNELNANLANGTYKGYQVVAAYPMGSPSIPLNAKRIPTFTEEIKKLGVEVVDSIPALLKKVDVVLLETNDGNKHLEQAELILKAKKPLFIDKPIANSYEEALKIFQLAEKYRTPVFSSSALRYIPGIDNIDRTKVLGAEIYSPAHTEPSHKDLYWYGIHGVEMLFTIMGTDCISVQTQHTTDADFYVAEWSGNRIATLRGTRKGVDGFGGTVFTDEKIITLGAYQGYAPLLQRIISFFETGETPVASTETLAICKFIDAAYQSRLNGGAKVFLKI